MSDVLWFLFLSALGGGYLMSVLWIALEGGFDEAWWLPWAAAVVMPFYQLYEYRDELCAVVAGVAGFVALFGLVWSLGEIARWG